MVSVLEMKYDLIIVASSSSQKLIDITQRCIDSARQDDCDLNIIVVETFSWHDYERCQILIYDGEFCYNKALNLGLTKAVGDVYILANNDLYFHKGWSEIGSLMHSNGFESSSALSNVHMKQGILPCDNIYEGYHIGTLLTGWCIFVTRSCIDKIGLLDETYTFWCSDNAYADQLKAQGIRHGLFCNVRVDHLTSATLKTLPVRKQRKYAFGNINKYRQTNAIR